MGLEALRAWLFICSCFCGFRGRGSGVRGRLRCTGWAVGLDGCDDDLLELLKGVTKVSPFQNILTGRNNVTCCISYSETYTLSLGVMLWPERKISKPVNLDLSLSKANVCSTEMFVARNWITTSFALCVQNGDSPVVTWSSIIILICIFHQHEWKFTKTKELPHFLAWEEHHPFWITFSKDLSTLCLSRSFWILKAILCRAPLVTF